MIDHCRGLLLRRRPFRLAILLIGVLGFGASREGVQQGSVRIASERKQWHDLVLTLDGPTTGETADPIPFLDYRLTITFSKGPRRYQVSGYFAADGNAAESGATEGNKWRVRFVPDEPRGMVVRPSDSRPRAARAQGPEMPLTSSATSYTLSDSL